MDLHTPAENVEDTVDELRMNPLIPKDVPIHGLIFHPRTGEIEVIVNGYTQNEAILRKIVGKYFKKRYCELSNIDRLDTFEVACKHFLGDFSNFKNLHLHPSSIVKWFRMVF